MQGTDYDREILRVLTEAGTEGLSVAKITRHVYNASNTFFETVDFEEVHRHVASFLLRNSKLADSLVEKAERGVYRLNLNSRETSQLMLQFKDHGTDADEAPVRPVEDQSLSLFDGF